MIIDFHTHTFPDKIAAAAIGKLQDMAHIPAFTNGTVQGLADSMQAAQIKTSVVLPVATNPAKVQSMNDVSVQLDGQNGLVYFGCAHPDMENPKEEMRRIACAGLKGVKIHPVYQGVDMDDVRFLRILEAAGEENLIVVTHAGDDIGFPGVTHCAPRMIKSALKQVGPVKFIAAHMGGWHNWDEVMQELPDSSVMIDTSFSLGAITPRSGENHYTQEQLQLLSAERFCEIVRLFGSERVLFGSDSPWGCQTQAVRDFLNLPLTENEKQDILHHNALRLLKI